MTDERFSKEVIQELEVIAKKVQQVDERIQRFSLHNEILFFVSLIYMQAVGWYVGSFIAFGKYYNNDGVPFIIFSSVVALVIFKIFTPEDVKFKQIHALVISVTALVSVSIFCLLDAKTIPFAIVGGFSFLFAGYVMLRKEGNKLEKMLDENTLEVIRALGKAVIKLKENEGENGQNSTE